MNKKLQYNDDDDENDENNESDEDDLSDYPLSHGIHNLKFKWNIKDLLKDTNY